MKYATAAEPCVICQVGTAHPTHGVRYEEMYDMTTITEFSVCDHCESQTANAAQMSINKLRYLEVTCIPRVTALHVLMKTSYPLSPHVYFDDSCDPKRQKVLGLIAGELFDAQLALAAAFREFDFVYATGAGSTPFHYLAGQYGSLNLRIKEMKALVKKHGKQQEVVDYFRVLESCVLNISPYDLMKSDFEMMMSVFKQRRKEDIRRFPQNGVMWETLDIDWELVKKNFKEAK